MTEGSSVGQSGSLIRSRPEVQVLLFGPKMRAQKVGTSVGLQNQRLAGSIPVARAILKEDDDGCGYE